MSIQQPAHITSIEFDFFTEIEVWRRHLDRLRAIMYEIRRDGPSHDNVAAIDTLIDQVKGHVEFLERCPRPVTN